MAAWQTRGEARSQPFTALTDAQIEELLGVFEARMQAISDDYLRKMGEHIAEIGTLWPSDVHRLQQMRRMRRNIADIQRQIARAAGMSVRDVQKVFKHVAAGDVRMAAQVLMKNPALVNDAAVRRIMNAQLRETAGRLTNLANTTVVSDAYRRAVDAGVSAVQSGVEDYGSAIRRSLREAGQMGLRIRDDGSHVVDYESGYSRRLDTAVRQNVLDGVRHLNQSIMEEVGRELGADGIEIDAHMLCAEDHLPYQGLQFSNADFEEIQASLSRPFGEWNCRHSWHPILLGLSEPAYSREELQEMRDYSMEEIEIEGRTKTRYEWSQEMRRCETMVRQQKDVAKLAQAAEDDTLRRQCQKNIVALNDRYKQLADGAGLKPKYKRMFVQGFKDAKSSTLPSERERERLKSSYPNTVATKALDAPGYLEKFRRLTESEAVNRSIYNCAVQALTHRNGTTGEDLYLINGRTGEILHANTSSTAVQTVKYEARTLAAIAKAHADGIPIIALHNHPNGMPPSLDDGASAFVHGYAMGVVVGHNLEVYSYSASDKAYDSEYCQRIHSALSRRIGYEFDFDDEVWYNALRKFGMEVQRQ